MSYFRTIGGKLIFAGVIALETVFAAGIWFMISVGLSPALGDWSYVLAFIVAPVIGILAIVMFSYGHTLKRIILEYEALHGRHYNAQEQVYYNKPSITWFISAIRVIVIVADTAGIVYRIQLERGISLFGQVLLFIVFECLALLPWFVGTLVHIVANRPVEALQRDVDYIRDVTEAYNELEELKEEQEARKQARKVKAPATARYRIPAPAPQARPFVDPHLNPTSQANQVSMNQNGQTSK